VRVSNRQQAIAEAEQGGQCDSKAEARGLGPGPSHYKRLLPRADVVVGQFYLEVPEM
jgi:hypothetical protein